MRLSVGLMVSSSLWVGILGGLRSFPVPKNYYFILKLNIVKQVTVL